VPTGWQFWIEEPIAAPDHGTSSGLHVRRARRLPRSGNVTRNIAAAAVISGLVLGIAGVVAMNAVCQRLFDSGQRSSGIGTAAHRQGGVIAGPCYVNAQDASGRNGDEIEVAAPSGRKSDCMAVEHDVDSSGNWSMSLTTKVPGEVPMICAGEIGGQQVRVFSVRGPATDSEHPDKTLCGTLGLSYISPDESS
jgi:hypothetical protein